MELKDKAWIGFCLLVAGVGTLFSIVAYHTWQSTNRLIHDGIQTQGLVIDNRLKPTRGLEQQSTARAPVVRFQTTGGKTVLYYSQTYTNPVQVNVGDTVPIWYLPNDPQQATLEGVDAWIFPLVFGLFGIVFSLIGYPALISSLLPVLKAGFLKKATA